MRLPSIGGKLREAPSISNRGDKLMKWTRLAALALSALLFASAIALAQSDADASMERAKKLYRTRDYRGAVSELQKTLELDPGRAEALYLEGYAQLMLRQYTEAVDTFSHAFEADPTFDPRTIYQKKMEKPAQPTD
jgi:tetratricopeptide (TPR) repeat protein